MLIDGLTSLQSCGSWVRNVDRPTRPACSRPQLDFIPMAERHVPAPGASRRSLSRDHERCRHVELGANLPYMDLPAPSRLAHRAGVCSRFCPLSNPATMEFKGGETVDKQTALIYVLPLDSIYGQICAVSVMASYPTHNTMTDRCDSKSGVGRLQTMAISTLAPGKSTFKSK